MKALRHILPHLTISLALALTVVTIVDSFNPAMAFLSSAQGRILIFLTVIFAVFTAIILMVDDLVRQFHRIEAASDMEQQQADRSKSPEEQDEDASEQF